MQVSKASKSFLSKEYGVKKYSIDVILVQYSCTTIYTKGQQKVGQVCRLRADFSILLLVGDSRKAPSSSENKIQEIRLVIEFLNFITG
jgi:hypothetical protein